MTFIDIISYMGLFTISVVGLGIYFVLISLWWEILQEGTWRRKALELGSVLDPLAHPAHTLKQQEDFQYAQDEYETELRNITVWKEKFQNDVT